MAELNSQMVSEQVKEIKQSFDSYKNGVTAQSMREKGISYHVNWGVALTDLQQLAQRYRPNAELAQSLWHENVRECKIMALLLMPPSAVDELTAHELLSTLTTTEMADMAAFLLFQYVECRMPLGQWCISQSDNLIQQCGYQLLSRLLRNGMYPSQSDLETFKEQARLVINRENDLPFALRKAAFTCLSILDTACDVKKNEKVMQ